MTVNQTKKSCWLYLVALLLVLVGCTSRPITGPLLKNSKSYDYSGEQVAIHMLDRDELVGYSEKAHPGDASLITKWHKALNDNIDGINAGKEAAPAFLIPLAVGVVVDGVKAELEKEASLYEAQFGATLRQTGFWKNINSPTGTTPATAEQRWFGFEITRTTDASTEPAFRLVCAIIPATRLKTSFDQSSLVADERIFLIKPMWIELNRSKAKVFILEDKVDLDVNIQFDAIWVDRSQQVHDGSIATAQFSWNGLILSNSSSKNVVIPPVDGPIAGWFAGVPISSDSAGNPKGNGTFRLSATITERDPSQVREIIERAAKYLGDNRGKIINQISGGN